MRIFILNAGSSSLKFELFQGTSPKNLTSLHEGHFDHHGKPIPDFETAVKKAVEELLEAGVIKGRREIDAVGHRVVHGGERYSKPVRITAPVLKEIEILCDLAPLHNPPNLSCIRAAQKLFPGVPQIAVFDTAFHHTMPEVATNYAIPYSLAKKYGIRRYGFHGISHQYVFEQARKKLGSRATARTVTCHLGNGCSLAAILRGKVIDTSMGFTPLEGVPMGTRSGDIDPSIIFFLLAKGMTPVEVEETLNKKSGLAGLSELSSDVRELWAAYQKKDGGARRALHFFSYRIAKYIGSFQAALGGLDCVVFTGGTGVGAWYLRKWIMKHFPKFPKNRVLVIPTDEEHKIAEEVIALAGL